MTSPVNPTEGTASEHFNSLKQLGRTELLEMMLAQSRLNDQLSRRVEELETQLADRTLRVSQAGSMAEAALALNGVFEAAEAACQQYMENLSLMDERQRRLSEEIAQCTRESTETMVEETRRECEELREKTQRECEELSETTRRECEELRAKTQRECEEKQQQANRSVEEKWGEISSRLLALYASHQGLKELVEQGLCLTPTVPQVQEDS